MLLMVLDALFVVAIAVVGTVVAGVADGFVVDLAVWSEPRLMSSGMGPHHHHRMAFWTERARLDRAFHSSFLVDMPS